MVAPTGQQNPPSGAHRGTFRLDRHGSESAQRLTPSEHRSRFGVAWVLELGVSTCPRLRKQRHGKNVPSGRCGGLVPGSSLIPEVVGSSRPIKEGPERERDAVEPWSC